MPTQITSMLKKSVYFQISTFQTDHSVMNRHQQTTKGSQRCASLKQQCSQHQAGRAAPSFFDLGTGLLAESLVVEDELWWAELTGLEPAGVDNREIFLSLEKQFNKYINSNDI